MNPFEASGSVNHFPSNFSSAFNEIGSGSNDTASLLGSKLTFSNADKKSTLKYSSGTEQQHLSIADLTNTETFEISKSSEHSFSVKTPQKQIYSKPSAVKTIIKEKIIHCKTCSCIAEKHEGSTLNLQASESLKMLSKLESIPLVPFKAQGKPKHYVSPLYKISSSASQVFRQRINAHMIQHKVAKTPSQTDLLSRYKSNNLLY